MSVHNPILIVNDDVGGVADAQQFALNKSRSRYSENTEHGKKLRCKHNEWFKLLLIILFVRLKVLKCL